MITPQNNNTDEGFAEPTVNITKPIYTLLGPQISSLCFHFAGFLALSPPATETETAPTPPGRPQHSLSEITMFNIGIDCHLRNLRIPSLK